MYSLDACLYLPLDRSLPAAVSRRRRCFLDDVFYYRRSTACFLLLLYSHWCTGVYNVCVQYVKYVYSKCMMYIQYVGIGMQCARLKLVRQNYLAVTAYQNQFLLAIGQFD